MAAAMAVLTEALHVMSSDPDLNYVSGVGCARQGRHTEAIVFFQRALAARPEMTSAWLALGHAHARSADFAAALAAYQSAATLEPSAPDVHYNIGVARRALGDLDGGALAFYRAWRLDGMFGQAAKACVGTVGELARTGIDVPLDGSALACTDATVTVIVCSIDAFKSQRIVESYERAFAGVTHDIVLLRDARSLAEAYNRGIALTRSDIVILSHDDIDLPSPSFAARLLAHLAEFDAVGVVGSTRIAGPTPLWAGHPHLRGWIAHRSEDGLRPGVLHADPCAPGIAVLDGVLLAARRRVLEGVPFDEQTFDGFHGYDLDWSVRAAHRGYRLAAAGDLGVIHASRGRYDTAWETYAHRFCAKHGIAASEPPSPPYYETSLPTQSAVLQFFERLVALAQDVGG